MKGKKEAGLRWKLSAAGREGAGHKDKGCKYFKTQTQLCDSLCSWCLGGEIENKQLFALVDCG
jgi:hypothetical protein